MNMTYLLDVANHTAVVTRISLVFRRHGANLHSLSTARTECSSIVRIVVTADLERRAADRIKGQLAKLIDILRVDMVAHEEGTFRAFGMMKIACTLETRPQILQLVEIFRARVLELTPQWVLVEITGTPEELEGLLQILKPYGVLEAVSSGPVVIRRESPKPPKQAPEWELVTNPATIHASPNSMAAQERKRYGTDFL